MSIPPTLELKQPSTSPLYITLENGIDDPDGRGPWELSFLQGSITFATLLDGPSLIRLIGYLRQQMGPAKG